MAAFRVTLPLRFAHCDPAGIAYYPRYFELADAAIEDWTLACFGVDRRTFHQDIGLGLPTVSLSAEFAAASRLGDVLEMAVTVTAIGDSSVGLRVLATCAGEGRFDVRYTQVLIDVDRFQAKSWPEEWRAALAAWKDEEAQW